MTTTKKAINVTQYARDLLAYLLRAEIRLSVVNGRLRVSASPEVLADFDDEGRAELKETLTKYRDEVVALLEHEA